MGNKSKTLSDPLVVNVDGELLAAIASLRKRFGLLNLSIVMKNGKYFLDVDGQLIEITFVNGKIIPADVFENLNARLEALLEQNGFEPLTLNELPTAEISQEERAQGLALFSFASIGMLAHNRNDRSDGTFELEEITTDAQNDTIVLDYNQRLNQNIKPTPDDFEVLINNVPTLVSDIRITDDKVILKFGQDILSGDSVLVTYKDQNGDTQASIQSANGELASAFIQGVAIDGYIAGAQMFIDKDGDGIPDPDELLEGITTNANGMFILDAALNPESYPLLIVGGTNKDTGLANNTVLSAPPGSTVITPTTTLVQTMLRNEPSMSADEAEETVKNALGIPNTINLRNFDPINAIERDPLDADAMALHKANTSIVEIIESVGAENPSNAMAAADEIAKLMVEQSSSNEPADWLALSSEVVDSVLENQNTQVIKATLQQSIRAIQEAEGPGMLAEVAIAQLNASKSMFTTVKGANIYAEKQDGTQRSLNVTTDNTGRFILEETQLKKIESNNEIIVAKDGYDILFEKPQLIDYKAELGKELNFFDTIGSIRAMGENNTDVSSTNLALKRLFEELKPEATSSEIDLLAKNKAYDEPMIDLLKSLYHYYYLTLENELEVAQRLDQSIQPIAFYKAEAEGSLPKILGQNYDTYLELIHAYYETPEFEELLFDYSIEISNVVKQIDDLWENPETVRELQRKDMLDWYEDKAYLIGIDFDGDEKYLGKNEARLTTESIQQFTIGDESSNDNTVSFWFDISQLTAGSSITLITTDGVVAESNPISQSDINKEIYQFSDQNGKTVFELQQNDNSNTDLGLYIDGTKIDGLEISSEEDMLEGISVLSNHINGFSIVAFKTVNDGNEYLDQTIYDW